MKPTFPILIPNERSKQACIAGVDTLGHPTILAGKMKRPDSLMWSAYDNGSKVTLTGLWRQCPNYGEVIVNSQWFYAALVGAGFIEDAKSLAGAMTAWGFHPKSD